MAIQVGDKIPNVKLWTIRNGKVETASTGELFAGKKVVLFGVPGAFTSTCSDHHLPGFIELADELKARGADLVACTAVNDIEVLSIWLQHKGARDRILPLADGNGDFARALGLELDARDYGLGIRSQRYAAVIEDGVVRKLNVDPPGEVRGSSAAVILQAM